MTSSQSPADDIGADRPVQQTTATENSVVDPEAVVFDSSSKPSGGDADGDGLNKEPNDETEKEKFDDSSLSSSSPSSEEDDFDLRIYRFSVMSDILFLLASVFYVALGVNDYLYAKQLHSLPNASELLAATDDEIWEQSGFTDDYVFQTGPDTWVSRYEMFYFIAAFCFVLTGVLDFILSPGWLAVVLILAGACGVASASLTEYHEDASDLMNIISVHLFLVEAAGLLFSRSSFKNWKLTWLVRIGNLLWIGGALTDCITSYFDILGTGSTVPHAIVGVASSTLWLACALTHMRATCIYGRSCRIHKDARFCQRGGD